MKPEPGLQPPSDRLTVSHEQEATAKLLQGRDSLREMNIFQQNKARTKLETEQLTEPHQLPVTLNAAPHPELSSSNPTRRTALHEPGDDNDPRQQTNHPDQSCFSEEERTFMMSSAVAAAA